MAPAAKESSQGMTAPAAPAISTAITPKTGSTIPERPPYKNAFPAGSPSLRSGREIAAPSGKFCMPIPMAKAAAEERAANSPPGCAASAKARPTAMPSGILCRVTANIRRVLLLKDEGIPSGF